MKTKTTSKRLAAFGAAAGIVAALLALSGAFAPVFAAGPGIASTATTTMTTTTSTSTSLIPGLQVGQNFTITSTSGHYKVVGDPSENGSASGSMTFTVTGKFTGGYSISITGGSLTVSGSLATNATTFAVSGGSAEVGPYAHHLVGQGIVAGATSSSTGSFLVRATARGTFGGDYATMSLDLESGTTEYAIALVGSI